MYKENVLSVIEKCSLFSGLTRAGLSELADKSTVVAVNVGDDANRFLSDSLAIILSGSANVYSNDRESDTLLRVLSECDVFGIAGLLSGHKEISRVIVKSPGFRLLAVPKSEILRLITQNPEFSQRYISFLEKKIIFLNRRINAFTAGSCERRLAIFLASVSGDESYEVGPIPFSGFAKQLNMGRASFYRSLEALEKDGIIKHGQKSVFVISRTLLKEKYMK